MKKKNTNFKFGFTLIEVAMVLAIAGLIFLMVFQVVPTVRRNQQDTARNEILGTVQSQLMNWQTAHNGNLPKVSSGDYVQWEGDETFPADCSKNVACEFVRNYMNTATDDVNSFKDPNGEYFNVVITKNVNKGFSGLSVNFTPTEASAGTATSALKVEGDTATIDSSLDGAFDAHVIYIIPGATCNENQAVSSKRNNFAVLYYMESSGVTCRGTNS